MTTYLIHPEHGTHIAYSPLDIEELKKVGWKLRPDDWVEQQLAKKRAAQKAELLAQLDRMEARETVDAEPEKPKRKYTRKAA